jgi:hypothetical protein
MALTIGLCILTSAWIFGEVEPLVADFTGYDRDNEQSSAAGVVEEATEEADAAQTNSQPAELTPESGSVANSQPTVAPVAQASTQQAFTPTHESNPDFTVNFRPGPSIDSGDPVAALDPGTPLQYLGQQTTGDDGSVWLQMTTEDGTVGWLREVDTVELGA